MNPNGEDVIRGMYLGTECRWGNHETLAQEPLFKYFRPMVIVQFPLKNDAWPYII